MNPLPYSPKRNAKYLHCQESNLHFFRFPVHLFVFHLCERQNLTTLFFGPEIISSVNLNFANINFDFGPSAPPILQEVGHVVSTIVVMFPALDTLSVFPLIANT